MKYYIYSVLLLIFSILVVTFVHSAVAYSQNSLLGFEVPSNSPQVAGIEKINLPPVGKNITPPIFTARSVLIKDLATGVLLYQKDAGISVPIASTTKVMTSIVASEYFKDDSILTIGDSADTPGSRVGFSRGETLTFQAVLYGMLLDSGNDAAYALAENYPGGVPAFVGAMNKKAKDLGLTHTQFDNPAGFDSPNHYSSASDLAVITEEALKNTELSKVFATKDTDIVSLDKKYSYKLHNLNKLLSSVSGVLGIKTGQTEAAKENLITLVDRGGHRVLVVVLGSDDRFGESTSLIEWAYQNFNWPDF